ncbi:MAG TPA: alpha/beta fold hydrolase [Candidatus Nitrosotenuis sp.]|jgi:pimeloyl-ACP methyl ester carboxylesterase|nr:alpha/beta fold hydrolase [Candidatus Nitrosotenuis sp.]
MSYRTIALLTTFILTTQALAHDEEENSSSWSNSFFTALFTPFKTSKKVVNDTIDCSYDYSEQSTASSLRFCGADRLVYRGLTPRDGEAYTSSQGYAKTVDLLCLDNVHLTGQWLKVNNHGPTMLLCHGNGMVSQDYSHWAHWFAHHNVNTLAFTIRGYPGSEGSSKEIARTSPLDIEAALRFLVKDQKISFDRIGVYGFSLGGGYATYAMRYFNLPGILQNTLPSVGDVIRNVTTTWLPETLANGIARSHLDNHAGKIEEENLGLFATLGMKEIPLNSFNNKDNLSQTKAPVMFIYGENDQLMGKEQGAMQLYQGRYGKTAEVDPSLFVKITHGGHTDVFFQQPQAEKAVENFLEKIFK